MKIVLDVAEKTPTNYDVIAYDVTKGKWVAMSRVKFLEDANDKIFELQKEIENLKTTISNLKDSVNKNMKTYHNVLQTLVKENK